MQGISIGRAGLRLGAVALVAAAAWIAVAAPPSTTAQAPAAPTCTGSAKVQDKGRFDVRFRLRCDFEVQGVVLRASRRVTRVRKEPTVTPADAGGMTCKRRPDPQRARCGGSVLSGARIVGALSVKGDPCEKPRLRLHAVVSGSNCRPDAPCTANIVGDLVPLPPAGC